MNIFYDHLVTSILTEKEISLLKEKEEEGLYMSCHVYTLVHLYDYSSTYMNSAVQR